MQLEILHNLLSVNNHFHRILVCISLYTEASLSNQLKFGPPKLSIALNSGLVPPNRPISRIMPEAMVAVVRVFVLGSISISTISNDKRRAFYKQDRIINKNTSSDDLLEDLTGCLER